MNEDNLTLAILLDAGRHDYVEYMPFINSMKDKGVYTKRIVNPGGYCERSCFMTGASPSITGNLFAMSLMPIGYKRAYYEPKFNIPKYLRDRLCMTEDNKPDTEYASFYNPDKGISIESIWDVMSTNGVTWTFEACLALGILSYKGKTTHGSRPQQLLSKIKKNHPQFAYIQFSEIDQQAHVRGSNPKYMRNILTWADGEVKRLYEEVSKLYDNVNLLIFGDHGQTMVKEYVDIPLEYDRYVEGWDYLYLKSSAAIQFWIFNDLVKKHILKDPILKKYGEFIDSPSKRQGDLIWRANKGILVSPCHFHNKNDAPVSMHGYDPKLDTEKGFAIVVDGKHKGIIEEASLLDICPTITDLVGVRNTKFNEGKSLCINTHK